MKGISVVQYVAKKDDAMSPYIFTELRDMMGAMSIKEEDSCLALNLLTSLFIKVFDVLEGYVAVCPAVVRYCKAEKGKSELGKSFRKAREVRISMHKASATLLLLQCFIKCLTLKIMLGLSTMPFTQMVTIVVMFLWSAPSCLCWVFFPFLPMTHAQLSLPVVLPVSSMP